MSLLRCHLAVHTALCVATLEMQVNENHHYSLSPLSGLGPTNSGTIPVAQKPYSSSAPRVYTWIIATSIRICNRASSTHAHAHASPNAPHPPTPRSLLKERVHAIGDTICAIHFRGPSIRRGSCNTLLSGFLLSWTPTRCLNTWTPLMVSVLVYLGTLRVRLVHPITP